MACDEGMEDRNRLHIEGSMASGVEQFGWTGVNMRVRLRNLERCGIWAESLLPSLVSYRLCKIGPGIISQEYQANNYKT